MGAGHDGGCTHRRGAGPMRSCRVSVLAAAILLTAALSFSQDRAVASEAKTTADIKPGHALVIGRSYDRIFGGSSTRTKRLLVVFQRFDPPTPGARFGWWGEADQFNAASVPPGRYHFRVWDDGNVIFTY